MLDKINKNKYLFKCFVIFAFLPLTVLAQGIISGESKDYLLEQYLFPISTYQESNIPQEKMGSECNGFKSYNDVDFTSCDRCVDGGDVDCLTDATSSDDIHLATDETNLFTKSISSFSYTFSVSDENTYIFKLQVSNENDDFSQLTTQQLDFIFNTPVPSNDSYEITAEKDLTILEYSDLNTIYENNKYKLYKSMVFAVYVDGQDPINRKGFITINNNGTSQINSGTLMIGNLETGEHTVYLHFISDFEYDFNAKVTNDELPAHFQNFIDSDKNEDHVLEVNPIIHQVSIDATSPTVDVIGVRVYSNLDHKDPVSWYQDNVINASDKVKEIMVDGYQAIEDDRTVYVNAANLDRGNFFTNIYVIAYNQEAASETVNIYEQMLDHWVFNQNVVQGMTLEAGELEKDKLRRDTIRMGDVNNLNKYLENYKATHGNTCPKLDAGTFVQEHSISTWPSWQENLGTALGHGLPVDPLNIMSTEFEPQNDCTDPTQSEDCQNVCTRDGGGNALTGCRLNEQCYNDYCSICPPGYDPETCWDDNKLEFYDLSMFDQCDENYNQAFLLNGSSCVSSTETAEIFKGCTGDDPTSEDCEIFTNDGAFVYQYVSRDNGQSCSFVNRFEYTAEDVCPPGYCFYDNNDGNDVNNCFPPGACLAGCNESGDECEFYEFQNLNCYLGSWRNSCGDGFLESQCGELCDPNIIIDADSEQTWCDLRYGQQDWHEEGNIQGSCNNICELEGLDFDIFSCGGFCGDKVEQGSAGEQCDKGQVPALLSTGLGGSDETLQYMCSGIQSDEEIKLQGADCEGYTNDWYKYEYDDCSSLAEYVAGTSNRVNKSEQGDDTYLVGLGGFRVSYEFNVARGGIYNLFLETANYNDNLYGLTGPQIRDLVEERGTDVNFYNLDDDGNLDIPEIGVIDSGDPQFYDYFKSFVYNVYLDNDIGENLIGNLVMPAHDTSKIGKGVISVGYLDSGTHTVYLHFVSDHFYIDNVVEEDSYYNIASGDPASDVLDITPVIYSVSLSSEQSVGSCQTYGGYCGDGIVQLNYGEQCDVKTYLAPSPQKTSNLVINSSFEGVFTPWQKDYGKIELDGDDYFEGTYGLSIDSDTNTQIGLFQSNSLLDGKLYDISIRLKGALTDISFKTGDVNSWHTNIVDFVESSVDKKGDWFLYNIDNFVAPKNVYRIRFIFDTEMDNIFYIDDIKISPNDVSGRPQYQCGTDSATNQLCQFQGGFCGDGLIQRDFSENCDDRVGLSCSENNDCGLSGTCQSGECVSEDCNDLCKSTFCGDGIIQRPNSSGINEICDWGSDPQCAYSCQGINIGGLCTNDQYGEQCDPQTDSTCRTCAHTLSCTIRNFGDIDTKCLGIRGSYGCRSNNDCILGYYCDVGKGKCEAEVSTYLKYHSEASVSLDLPKPTSPTISYDINVNSCPELRSISTSDNNEYVNDQCTGITWLAFDNISRIDSNWNYNDAMATACLSSTRLPTITELYSLVKQTNYSYLYTDNDILRFCPVNCSYDNNEDDLCEPCFDDNYIYWSSNCTSLTCSSDDDKPCKSDADCSVGACDGPCSKALAINYKYGSIEAYDVDEEFKIRCLKDNVCGNSIIEEGEDCEFYKAADESLIEQNISRQCSEFGYDEGFLHCDSDTCNFRLDNCVMISEAGQSCNDVCNKKILGCESVGLNINEVDDEFEEGFFAIANDNTYMNIDGSGNCVIPGESIDCDYPFIDTGSSCRDTLTNELSPLNTEYSYCNCDE